MEHIESERNESVLVLSLARGKANALNLVLVEELYAAVRAAGADDSVRALVLASSRPRFFSSGFDVREVFQYDRPGMKSFFGRFIDLYEALYHFPKPTVAALSGHTFAGGAILAIACDFRIMADGDFGFALNEINLGLALTPGIRRMLIGCVGTAHASEVMLFGEPLTPARSLEIGLVRELAPADEVRGRALACAKALASKPVTAFREIKRALHGFDGETPGSGDRATLDQFIGMWFSPEAEQCRKAVAARL
ncbi:MAG: enoyl-CoA hydratase/isomerase family protein [Bryobacteraceae bacterium]